MKHISLLFCFCSVMGLAQSNQTAEPSNSLTNPSSNNQRASGDEGPFLRHLKQRNSIEWKGTKRVAAKVAKDAGMVVATVAAIPAVPVIFVGLVIHCSFHDCSAS